MEIKDLVDPVDPGDLEDRADVDADPEDPEDRAVADGDPVDPADAGVVPVVIRARTCTRT